ncbi:hypothetical protein E2C01_067253 [Portunus trituberculatus]|uniref:Uncharacterized protein n=1 Tax=Portunus trituberculatus TaxID=210409 RepID=A0A5B7HT41_PORTR|nr:hypothetical protein [Portunus trituberculatus]
MTERIYVSGSGSTPSDFHPLIHTTHSSHLHLPTHYTFPLLKSTYRYASVLHSHPRTLLAKRYS